MIKKIISFCVIILILFWLFQNNSFAYNKNKKTKFRITAYYSPLPNQTHYIKWSYEAEVLMNGKGIRWASWKKVFSGMLAAPSKYPFWTKIYLKWLWVAEVADRWWAIVKAGQRKFKYDRIDIWCGYWEKGLQRAMFWWNRVIEWKIVSKKSKVSLNIKKIPAPRWTIYYAIKNPDYLKTGTIKRKIYLSKKVSVIKIKKESINKSSPIIPFHKKNKNSLFNWPIKNSDWVKKLQKVLKEMKLYSGKIDWQYKNIRKIILSFQLKNKIIRKKTDLWAGNFGPKTRKTLKQKYNIFKEKIKQKKLEKKKKLEKQKKAKKLAKQKIKFIWNIKFWDISPQVRELQKILKKLWYFKYKDTAIFGEKTKKAILKYQLDKKIIPNSKIYWAGMFWPKTKKSLIKDLTKILEKN